MKPTIKLLSAILLLVAPLVFTTNCRTARVKNDNKVSTRNSDEDFDQFYNRFHADSMFQTSRIVFPLKGTYMDGHEEKEWNKEGWIFLKTKIFDVDTAQYKIEYRKTNKTFTQKAWIENSGFSSECRFKIINKKWHLVYFLDQNI